VAGLCRLRPQPSATLSWPDYADSEVAGLCRSLTARLHALGTAVMDRFGDQVWTVADLARLGLVEPDETRALGHALGGVHGADGLIAGALLVRHKATRDGRLWQLKDPRW
jgi:hypothetical protein